MAARSVVRDDGQPDGAWWSTAPRTHRQKARLGLVVGTPVALAVLLIAAQGYATLVGCGSVDPTDPGNYSEVTVLNDTAGAVVVDDCPGAYCDAAGLPVRLPPGQTYGDHASCRGSGGDMTSWRLRDADGYLLGYVAVAPGRKQDGLVFRVSHASRDRRTPTPPG